MRLLITGANGQLGQALQKTLAAHELALADLPEIDITDRAQIEAAISDFRAEVVIHCAAYTDVDGCVRNPELAYRVNSLGSQNVALASLAAGAAMVHLSTNEVFAGEQPEGYEEWQPSRPINPYGRSKAAAEFQVRSVLPQHFIVRTAWLYAPGGHNFIHTILQRGRQDGAVRVVVDEIGNPTSAGDLAQALAQLITTGQYGTYHLVNEGACSRLAFAEKVFELAGEPDVRVTPIMSSEYPRASTPPPYAALLNLNGAALGIRLRPWQEALADYVAAHVLPPTFKPGQSADPDPA